MNFEQATHLMEKAGKVAKETEELGGSWVDENHPEEFKLWQEYCDMLYEAKKLAKKAQLQAVRIAVLCAAEGRILFNQPPAQPIFAQPTITQNKEVNT